MPLFFLRFFYLNISNKNLFRFFYLILTIFSLFLIGDFFYFLIKLIFSLWDFYSFSKWSKEQKFTIITGGFKSGKKLLIAYISEIFIKDYEISKFISFFNNNFFYNLKKNTTENNYFKIFEKNKENSKDNEASFIVEVEDGINFFWKKKQFN